MYNNSKKLWKHKNKEKVRLQNKRHKQKHKKELCYRENIRRALKIRATPKWANLDKIKEIYKIVHKVIM